MLHQAARQLDQFYTRGDVAAACVGHLKALIPDQLDNVLWIEPSAGAGAFVDHLPYPRIGLDIAPARRDISQADFLRWHPGQLCRDAIVVGNPPFGKNASAALRFFNHAATFAKIVAFIVPRTFQKQSLVSRLHPFMHLRSELALPDDAFLFQGEAYHVPTVFQIWERRPKLRANQQRRLTHPHFHFVDSASAHFAFQRVGARAGLVSREGLRKSPQSHYFLHANVEPDAVFKRLSSIDWAPVKSRTAGNPSIGKGELIELYEAALA
jgi:hypothetical protein